MIPGSLDPGEDFDLRGALAAIGVRLLRFLKPWFDRHAPGPAVPTPLIRPLSPYRWRRD